MQLREAVAISTPRAYHVASRLAIKMAGVAHEAANALGFAPLA